MFKMYDYACTVCRFQESIVPDYIPRHVLYYVWRAARVGAHGTGELRPPCPTGRGFANEHPTISTMILALDICSQFVYVLCTVFVPIE